MRLSGSVLLQSLEPWSFDHVGKCHMHVHVPRTFKQSKGRCVGLQMLAYAWVTRLEHAQGKQDLAWTGMAQPCTFVPVKQAALQRPTVIHSGQMLRSIPPAPCHLSCTAWAFAAPEHSNVTQCKRPTGHGPLATPLQHHECDTSTH